MRLLEIEERTSDQLAESSTDHGRYWSWWVQNEHINKWIIAADIQHYLGVRMIEVDDSNIPEYAVLSHRWSRPEDEVTMEDLRLGTHEKKSGWKKIQLLAQRAFQQNIKYIWVDSLCIDRSNSTELNEAVNSMYRYYKNSKLCYVHLEDVDAVYDILNASSDMHAFQNSVWWSRGWTLQELIAPRSVEFFDRTGVALGTKASLRNEISEMTGIPIKALMGAPLKNFSVAEKFRWAAKRTTTRPEDAAYSLFGIFDVHMPLLYGEGKKNALARLYRKAKQIERENTLARERLEMAQLIRSFLIPKTQQLGRPSSRPACRPVYRPPSRAPLITIVRRFPVR